jgi:hypothetical protein
MGDYEAAIAVARRACQTYPNFQIPYRTLIAGLGQIGRSIEARRVNAGAIERFGEDFLARYFGTRPAENRPEDHECLIEGWRKAGVLET